jgi:hypothetical protein
VVLVRPEANLGVLLDVALADLQEAAARPQDREAFGDCLARQGVDDYVHALAAGEPPDIVGEGEGARVHDVRDAQGAEVVALLGTAGGGEDFGPPRLGIRDGGQADPPAAAWMSTRSPGRI